MATHHGAAMHSVCRYMFRLLPPGTRCRNWRAIRDVFRGVSLSAWLWRDIHGMGGGRTSPLKPGGVREPCCPLSRCPSSLHRTLLRSNLPFRVCPALVAMVTGTQAHRDAAPTEESLVCTSWGSSTGAPWVASCLGASAPGLLATRPSRVWPPDPVGHWREAVQGQKTVQIKEVLTHVNGSFVSLLQPAWRPKQTEDMRLPSVCMHAAR